MTKISNDNPDSPLLKMPEVTSCQYLLEQLTNIGIAASTGFGLSPLTWAELHSWSVLTGTHITSWDAEQMILLSRSFVSFYNQFDDKAINSPHQEEEFDRVSASESIGSKLRMLATRMKK